MKSPLVFAAFVLAHVSVAQTVEEIPLRPPLPANTPQTTEEIVYRHNNYDDRGFNRAVQKITVPTLTVYHPAVAAHRRAAIVVCPGSPSDVWKDAFLAWLDRLP